MYQIDDPSAAPVPPAVPPAGAEGYFTPGDPVARRPFTRIRAWWLNMVQTELATLLARAGLARNKGDNTQVYQACEILFGLKASVVLIATGNWTVPPGCYAVRVRLVGGGAGGGSCLCTTGTINCSGGGGGAGGYAEGVVPVTPGQVIPYIIGNGGASGSGGGTTTFGPLSATGGASTSFVADSTCPGGSGGQGTGGQLHIGGGTGSDGQFPRLDGSSFIFAGNGANSVFGGGGRAGHHGGQNASAPGAGGGGAYDATTAGVTFAGGAGGNGIILLDFS